MPAEGAAAAAAARGPCAVCRVDARLACSRCLGVHYCGVEHQREDWARHRAHCACYRLADSPALGRHLVATRNIKKGSIIAKEEALVVVPLIKNGESLIYSCASCCNRQLEEKEMSSWGRCSDCGVPFCRDGCKRALGGAGSLHTAAECALLRRNRVVQRNSGQVALMSLCLARPLMLTGEKARSLKALDKNDESSISEVFTKQVVGWLANAAIIFKDEFDSEEVVRVAGIMEKHSFTYFDVPRGVVICGVLYPKTFPYFAHSCKPNAFFKAYRSSETDFTGAVAAGVDIAKGSPITIGKVDLLQPTHARREALQELRGFECHCVRCEDPSELGLDFCTICCKRCKGKGVMSVLRATGTGLGSPCKCKTCGFTTTFRKVREDIYYQFEKELGSFDTYDPKSVERMLTLMSYPKGLYHPSFALTLSYKRTLTFLYGKIPGYQYHEMPVELLERNASLCRDLLKVVQVYNEGYSTERGGILLFLARTLLEICRRKPSSGADKDSIQPILLEVTEMAKEIEIVFRRPLKDESVISLEKEIKDLCSTVGIS